MTLGPSRDKNRRRKEAALAAAFPQGIRCQKCLDYGHWSYECTGKRKFLTRPSRTQQLNRALKQREQMVLNVPAKCTTSTLKTLQIKQDASSSHSYSPAKTLKHEWENNKALEILQNAWNDFPQLKKDQTKCYPSTLSVKISKDWPHEWQYVEREWQYVELTALDPAVFTAAYWQRMQQRQELNANRLLELQNEIDQGKSSTEPKKKRQRLDRSDSSSSSSDSSSDSVSSTSSSSSDSEASTSSSSSSTSSSSSDSE